MKASLNHLLIILLGLSFSASGQSMEKFEKGSLIVYGDEFMFGIDEPTGWKGDIENGHKYYSNIIFYKSEEGLNNAIALIQVTNFGKKDEKTEKDLRYDIKTYKKKYKNLKQENFTALHAVYKCYSKMMYVDQEFYQYTAYINPGREFKSGLSVAMNISKRPANEIELKAFQQIIASIIILKG